MKKIRPAQLQKVLSAYVTQLERTRANLTDLVALGLHAWPEREIADSIRRVEAWIEKVSAANEIDEELLQKLSDDLDDQEFGRYSSEEFIEKLTGKMLRDFDKTEAALRAIIKVVQE